MNSRMETCQWTFECNYKSVGFFLAWPIANREMSVSKITLYTTGPNMQKESGCSFNKTSVFKQPFRRDILVHRLYM